MTTINRHNIVTGITLAILAVLPFLLSWLEQDYYLFIASKILIYALVGISLNLIIGQAGLVSFGHAAFFGLGAYVCAVLAHHGANDLLIFSVFPGTNNALISWPLVIVACLIFGAIIGLVSLRTQGVYFIMITLALAQMLFFLIISIPQYGGEDGLSLWQRNNLFGLDLQNELQFYYLCLGFVIAYLILAQIIIRSSFGLMLKAAKLNSKRLKALGFQPHKSQLILFIISAIGSGLAGALMVNLSEYVSPDYLHWSLSGKFLVIVILGGIGFVFGGLYGALILLGLEEILSSYTDHWNLILGSILILLVLSSKSGVYSALTGRKSP